MKWRLGKFAALIARSKHSRDFTSVNFDFSSHGLLHGPAALAKLILAALKEGAFVFDLLASSAWDKRLLLLKVVNCLQGLVREVIGVRSFAKLGHLILLSDILGIFFLLVL